MQNNIHAIDMASGELIWRTDFTIPTVGPNGLSIGYGIIAAGVGDTGEAVALDAATGEVLWRTDLTANMGEGIDTAPLIYDNTVYISTVPGNTNAFYRGGQKGIFYALDITSGHTIWQWDTTTDNLWGNARVNSGGGLGTRRRSTPTVISTSASPMPRRGRATRSSRTPPAARAITTMPTASSS
ncbi:MAG: PQQ-binding-like beta-propeller repeat protein [Thermomicrobiales bacterium]